MSGTCAKTLFPIRRSAFCCLKDNSFAILVAKNSTIVLIPFFFATFAIFRAGSIP